MCTGRTHFTLTVDFQSSSRPSSRWSSSINSDIQYATAAGQCSWQCSFFYRNIQYPCKTWERHVSRFASPKDEMDMHAEDALLHACPFHLHLLLFSRWLEIQHFHLLLLQLTARMYIPCFGSGKRVLPLCWNITRIQRVGNRFNPTIFNVMLDLKVKLLNIKQIKVLLSYQTRKIN